MENKIHMNIPIIGVTIREVAPKPDARGSFTEILRKDWNILPEISQVSYSRTYPGIIKAFHMHGGQNETWFVIGGNARVVLFDRRKDSASKGKTFEVIMGASSGKYLLYIPHGVAHGYQVLGNEPVEMLYIADTVYSYEKPDEIRFPFDDPDIGFDWSIKNR